MEDGSAAFALSEFAVEGVEMLARGGAIRTVGFALVGVVVWILLIGILCKVYDIALLTRYSGLLMERVMAVPWARASGMGGSLVGSQHSI